jgi:hypothetical protein
MRVLAPDLLNPDLERDGPSGDRARRRAHAQIQATKHAEFHALDLVLDLAYDSPLIAAGGARLPHAWLSPGRSVFDELGDGLSLLVAERGVDVAALSEAARVSGVPLRIVAVPGMREPLVLVRPDQHVAWHGDRLPADPGALLDRVRGAARIPAQGARA